MRHLPLTFPHRIPTPPFLAAAALAICAAWARGGTSPAWQAPLPILGVLTLLSLLWVGGKAKHRLLRDPIVWAGFLFLILLVIQWWNAGRFHYFDPFREVWGYTPAKIPWLTSAITRAEAAEMLRWFFPAWTLVAVLRCGGGTPAMSRWCIGAVAVNGAALAIFGMIQQWSGTTAIFWITEFGHTRFFASFGYENHAGSYFVLMSALSAGLLAEELFEWRRPPRVPAMVGWGLVGVCNFAGANLSYSRAAILLVWALAALVLAYLLWRGSRRWRPSTVINIGLAVLLTLAVGGLLVEQLGGKTIRKEVASLRQSFKPPPPGSPHETLLLGVRVALLDAAVKVWQDYPWFGCGGWGYRYLMPYKIQETKQPWHLGFGRANVHNDPAQFLAEFGVVGSGLMAFCAIGLAFPALRSREKTPLAVLALLGAGLVGVHSLVDLPFRSPAILYAWILALGGASLMCGRAAAGAARHAGVQRRRKRESGTP